MREQIECGSPDWHRIVGHKIKQFGKSLEDAYLSYGIFRVAEFWYECECGYKSSPEIKSKRVK